MGLTFFVSTHGFCGFKFGFFYLASPWIDFKKRSHPKNKKSKSRKTETSSIKPRNIL